MARREGDLTHVSTIAAIKGALFWQWEDPVDCLPHSRRTDTAILSQYGSHYFGHTCRQLTWLTCGSSWFKTCSYSCANSWYFSNRGAARIIGMMSSLIQVWEEMMLTNLCIELCDCLIGGLLLTALVGLQELGDPHRHSVSVARML